MDRIFDQAYREIDHPMTDLEFWRRMVKPILPNSQLELNFGVLTFYLDVAGYQYSDRGVMPDYPVAHTITDLLAGRDKDMELALSLARASEKGHEDR